MLIKSNLLNITVDGDELKVDEDFLRKCIHDKLYNIRYRKVRNAKQAFLAKKAAANKITLTREEERAIENSLK